MLIRRGSLAGRSLFRITIYRQLETHRLTYFPWRVLVYSIFGDAGTATSSTWADRPYTPAGRFLNASNALQPFHPRCFTYLRFVNARDDTFGSVAVAPGVQMPRNDSLKATTWDIAFEISTKARFLDFRRIILIARSRSDASTTVVDVNR